MLRVYLTTEADLTPFQKSQQTMIVSTVDNMPVIRTGQRIYSEEFLQSHPALQDKRFLHRPLNQDIIRRHTGLPAIENFPPHNSPGRRFQICGGIHDTRAFSTQFQCDWGQVDSSSG